MRDQILTNLNNPSRLEKLYRKNRADFKEEFVEVYPSLSGNVLADFWYERLNYESEPFSWGPTRDILVIIVACLAAGILSKFPEIFGLDEEFFYPRNIGFLGFTFLTGYFAWKNKLSRKKSMVIIGSTALFAAYINLLPDLPTSDTLFLACIHLPILIWGIFGLAFSGKDIRDYQKPLEFLRFNGDLVVMSALLGLAGILMSVVTIGLFSLIGFQIGEFYFQYLVAFALPSVPIVAAYLIRVNPVLVNKVSPVIARIFSPAVLVMLLIYLGAIVISGRDPYNDREFLLLFNLLLIGVMALIFFSVAESSTKETPGRGVWILLLLSVITILVNGIALSAILFRISEWGISPNRLAVLGANILILFHLLLVTAKLLKVSVGKISVHEVGKTMVQYLPVYFVWAFLVVFVFPVLFRFE